MGYHHSSPHNGERHNLSLITTTYRCAPALVHPEITGSKKKGTSSGGSSSLFFSSGDLQMTIHTDVSNTLVMKGHLRQYQLITC
jgi:hypothetical protein